MSSKQEEETIPRKNVPTEDEEEAEDLSNEATIKEIESLLAEFEEQEDGGGEGDVEETSAEEKHTDEEDAHLKEEVSKSEPNELGGEPEIEEIFAPIHDTDNVNSRSSSASRISVQEIPNNDEDEDEDEWVVEEGVEYNSAFEDEEDEEMNALQEEPADDVSKLLEEISAFEQELDKPNKLTSFADIQVFSDVNVVDDDDYDYDQDYYQFPYSCELDGEGANEEVEVERIDSEQEFLDTVMIIPEEEGEAALDKAALMSDVKDLLASFCHDELGTCDLTAGDEYVSSTIPIHNRCPSIESFFKQERAASVFIYLVPGRKMISKEVRLDTTIYELKIAVSRFCKMGPEFLDIRQKHNLLSNTKTLAELGGTPHKKMRFTVEQNKRMALTDASGLAIPDVGNKIKGQKPDTVRLVNVVVQVSKKTGDELVTSTTTAQRKVVIVHPKTVKPMIGGYKDKRTATVYHDAATTVNSADLEEEEAEDQEEENGVDSGSGVSSNKRLRKKTRRDFAGVDRAVQVFHNNDNVTQTPISIATQMDRTGIYCNSEDKDIIVYAKAYKTFEMLEQERAAAVTTIAKYWRRVTAKRNRQRRFEALIGRVAHAEQVRKGRQEERKRIMDEELDRQQNPTRLLDLELLYREINNWREEQEAYIKENRWGPERKAGLAMLAEMESDLLLELERTKRNIIAKGRERLIHGQFKQMSLPRRWFNPKSLCFLSFDTTGRSKSRKLHDIYKALLEPVQPSEEGHRKRMELITGVHKLLMIQEDLKSGQIPMADMLVDLFSREIKFMNTRGVPTLLSGIRHRVANTFFYLCMDPAFNEEAQRIDKIPWDFEKLKKDMVQCKGCRRMQYKDDFIIEKGTTLTRRCRTCVGLYRTAILRIDLNLYRQMLEELRRDEFQAGVPNSMSYLIDAFDMRILVEQIWHSQSALSGFANRYMLRLCRWKREAPWAPWNCILLSEEEAIAHLHLEDMDAAYQPTLIHKVRVKHATAKVYFHGLAKLSLRLDDRVEESCQKIKDAEKRAQSGIKRLRKRVNYVGLFHQMQAGEIAQRA